MAEDHGTKSAGTHVLVADDSPVYRKLVEGALAQHGYLVSFAKNGREAIDLVSDSHPTLLITDWEMPDLTGVELCSRIRRSENTSFTYIILLTSKTNKDQLIEGLAAGADDYLTKPFHPGELLARVAVGRRMAELHREVQTKNRLLEELARTDSLTGLPNRRAIEDWATTALEGAARHGFPFWVVMADLDRFKSINDSYGHEMGDFVLKRFAQTLRSNIRSSDICGRHGGEEFVAIITYGEKTRNTYGNRSLARTICARTIRIFDDNFSSNRQFWDRYFPRSSSPRFSATVTGRRYSSVLREKSWEESDRIWP